MFSVLGRIDVMLVSAFFVCCWLSFFFFFEFRCWLSAVAV